MRKDRSKYLVTLAETCGLSPEKILCLYLAIGDDIFFVLNMLAGQTIRIPPKRIVNQTFNKDEVTFVCELKSDKVKTPRGEKGIDKIEKGDVLDIKGLRYIAQSDPCLILGHNYVLLTEE